MYWKVHENPFVSDILHHFSKKDLSASVADVKSTDLQQIHPPNNTFIQFACDGSQVRDDVRETDRINLYTKHLLKNIIKKNVDVREMFRQITDDVYRESNEKQKPLSMNGLREYPNVYFNEVLIGTYEITKG